jgi:hypothetical protein
LKFPTERGALTQIESTVAAKCGSSNGVDLLRVAVEFTLAAIAFNLKRLHRVRHP